MTDPTPAPGGSPFDHLPLWLRDWRVFAVLLLVLFIGGQEGRNAIRGLLGLQPTATENESCCDALDPRLAELEAAARRNDAAHERILVALGRRGLGVIQPSTSGALTPPASSEPSVMSSVGSIP